MTSADATKTAQRKDSHLDLCATESVEPEGVSTLFGCVHLIHCALPEAGVEDVDLATRFLDKTLKLPLCLTGMTGGTPRAGQVNRDLAQLAERHGFAFGVGSQRAMAEAKDARATYAVRDIAPTTVILGNVGLSLAKEAGPDGVRRLMDDIGADGMAVHLNPAQELTQPEGDRDFKEGYRTIEALAKALGGRLLVKETGCGISPSVAQRLVNLGVSNIDVSGAGGTSWVRVEQLRAQGVAAEVGETLSTWGIPTAAAIYSVRQKLGSHPTLIASGGVRNGLEAAKALALGANLAGMALPFFRAQQQGGYAAAERMLEVFRQTLLHAVLLTGSRNVTELQNQPRVMTGELQSWAHALRQDG